jgi:hypothetical protein
MLTRYNMLGATDFGVAAGLMIASFGFMVNAFLLLDLVQLKAEDMGLLAPWKFNLLLALSIVCVAIPYIVITQFAAVVEEARAVETAGHSSAKSAN